MVGHEKPSLSVRHSRAAHRPVKALGRLCSSYEAARKHSRVLTIPERDLSRNDRRLVAVRLLNEASRSSREVVHNFGQSILKAIEIDHVEIPLHAELERPPIHQTVE